MWSLVTAPVIEVLKPAAWLPVTDTFTWSYRVAVLVWVPNVTLAVKVELLPPFDTSMTL